MNKTFINEWANNAIYTPMIIRAIHYPLLETSHGKVLQSLIQKIETKKSNILDIGGGGGTVKELIKSQYTVFDLPEIIENVTLKVNPNIQVIRGDIHKSDLTFIKKYNTVICNAFIDIMNNPTKVLAKILEKAKKYIILHRQIMINEPKSYALPSVTYGGIKTYTSFLSYPELQEMLSEYKWSIHIEVESGIEGTNNKSFILIKNRK